MTWLNSAFTIRDAIATSQDVYEAILGPLGGPNFGSALPAGWGSADDLVNGNLQFPPFGQPGLPSLAGIAIGPWSTVDRAWVSWDTQKLSPTAFNFPRMVSVESPLLFSMPGTEASNAGNADINSAMLNGSLYVFPQMFGSLASKNPAFTTILPTAYRIATAFTGRTFGVAANTNPNNAQVFIGQLLHLILYLRAPFQSPPTKRFVQNMQSPGLPPADNFPAGTEVCIGQVPVYGRKHIVVEITADDPATFRLGGLRAMNPNIAINRETTEASVTIGAANVVARMQLDNPNIDYLTVNVTDPGGMATAAPFTVTAYD